MVVWREPTQLSAISYLKSGLGEVLRENMFSIKCLSDSDSVVAGEFVVGMYS